MAVTDEYPAKLTTGYYRVRETWEDTASQIGAFRILANAIAKCDDNPGTYVFDDDGNAIYPEETEEESGIEEESGLEEDTTETGEEDTTEDTDDGAATVSDTAEDESADDATDEEDTESDTSDTTTDVTSDETDDTDEDFPEAEAADPVAYARLKMLMNIRTEPSLEAEILTTYTKGTIVSVLEILDTGWLKIICDAADEGYAYVSNVEGEYAYVGTSLYTVKSGDTLWKIAEENLGSGTLYKEIRTLNGLTSNTIKVGMQLILP